MKDRIDYECKTCQEGVNVPSKGIGRAIVAAWLTNHQGHDVQRGEGE